MAVVLQPSSLGVLLRHLPLNKPIYPLSPSLLRHYYRVDRARRSTSAATMALPLLLLLILGSSTTTADVARQEKRTTYIVHVAKYQMPSEYAEHSHWYDASLRSVSNTAEMLYTYDTVAHGFSTRLTPSEVESLMAKDGILSVVPDTRYELHTTRTPEFLGLAANQAFLPQSNIDKDVIIGVLDTGAWPELKSYDDSGLGPVPASWKGACEEGKGFVPSKACNRKLIGARFFSKGYEAHKGVIDESQQSKSPCDDDGHGSHTSTTAAGSSVSNASLFGFASGNARGMATRARVAVYKVCWAGGCFSSDILAALDKAVDDGVNILSLSLGGGQVNYYKDMVAVGSFAAMEKGIFVSCSAGNAGPEQSTLSNVAPWMTTVGAGTLDRDFPVFILLGNGNNYTGASLYSGKPFPENTKLDFIYAGSASNSTKGNLCMKGTLIPEKVKGKIVFCDRGISPRVKKGYVVKEAGGAGMILANGPANGEELVADAHLLPAAAVGQKIGKLIKSYLVSEANPKATIIFGGTEVGVKPSPVVAAFSSRGPNSVTPGILKPDVIAPGVNILAGWSGAIGPTGLSMDKRRTEFNIVSGTSMSCPHVSGLGALLKAAHPDWSPAAIRSALMTTAYNSYNSRSGGQILDVATGKPATAYDIGSGHVNPVRASDPGLVYDLGPDEYLSFLCALNYTSLQISAMSRRNFTCERGKSYSVSDLNYPSFTVEFPSTKVSSVRKHRRTVTNVGNPGTYRAKVTGTSDVKVTVEPEELRFRKTGEKQSYSVTFTSEKQRAKTASFGRLEWSDGSHVVGSPMVFTWA